MLTGEYYVHTVLPKINCICPNFKLQTALALSIRNLDYFACLLETELIYLAFAGLIFFIKITSVDVCRREMLIFQASLSIMLLIILEKKTRHLEQL